LERERRPADPTGGLAQGTFINPPPLIAPAWFQDRHVETRQLGDFLRDDSLRLMTVVGRSGVGKTAMVCRLLRSLERGRLPDNGGLLAVDGIVYLSASRSSHRPTLPDLYIGLRQLLPDDTARQLETVYKNPQATTAAMMEALVHAFPRGRTVVLLDKLEDVIAVETGRMKDAELDEALRALLELPPHGLKVIATTRVAPTELALVQPGRQRRLDIDAGLDHPFAEGILRAMDVDGKVGLRDAPPALLAKARDRTLGFPRALEHLFGILSADRNTTLEEILDDTRHLLPDEVVGVLVGEAFSRLDPLAQRVMQALATYRYPVPAAAVDYLLQPYVPGVDSGRVLGRLVNMQFARREANRYSLQQVDRDYALGRLEHGEPTDRDHETARFTRAALRHRAAGWFTLARKPREAWKTLDDLAAQLAEYDLRCDGEDYDAAAALLLEFDFDYLFLWGHYRLMIELHERIVGHIANPRLAQNSVGNLGSAYYRLGNLHAAKRFYERALHLAREQQDRNGEATWLGNLATTLSDLGHNALASEYAETALAIDREVANRRSEANTLGLLAVLYAEVGRNTRAVEYGRQALQLDREVDNAEGIALKLANLGSRYLELGRADDTLRCHEEALAIARRIGYRLVEADAHAGIGELRAFQNRWEEAAKALERAIEIADGIGNNLRSKSARERLALVTLYRRDVTAAREIAEIARRYDVPLANHGTSALLGVISCRQGDLPGAREAFTTALAEAEQLIALTPDRFGALDVRALSLCGLALCGDEMQIPAAMTAYTAARVLTSDPGVVHTVLQVFDALAQADIRGILAPVRSAAAGEQRGYEPSSA
jgi:tetratricopeptide (TPR) repeat protein